ncbi:MAG: hypothetical protein HFG76_10840 [Hungatella sp.]|nr:hypothetical protein [Hungatella sp.]
MNKKLIGGLGLASVALVGGTFAYFTQMTTIDNPFDTARYESVVTEDFVPEDGENWQPGVEVNKDLYVQNTGDRDVVVRVKFEDFWYRGDKLVTKAEDAENANTFKEISGQTVTDPVDQKDETDGKVEEDGTVVLKRFENLDQWQFNEADGYFYYKPRLAAGTSSDKFLDKVQLAPNLDLGKFNTSIYSIVDKKNQNLKVEVPEDYDGNIDDYVTNVLKWIHIETKDGKEVSVTPTSIALYNEKAGTSYTKESMAADNLGIYTSAITRAEKDLLGYSDANYVLRITVETVQATDKAVADKFATAPSDVVANWALDAEELETESVGE